MYQTSSVSFQTISNCCERGKTSPKELSVVHHLFTVPASSFDEC